MLEDWLKTALLGVVEGITEFLPISSTGHLLVATSLVRYTEALGGTFDIFIQFGAVLAVIGFYAADLVHQAQSFRREPHTRQFWAAILVAFLPAAIAGFFLRDFIKDVLYASPTVIAASFIIGGLVLIIVERLPHASRHIEVSSEDGAMRVGWRQALFVGVAQVLALVPGVSRSGATIVGGLLAGLDRPSATAFSFYLAIPTLGAATLYELARSLRALTTSDLEFLLFGTVVAGVVAWLSIAWLLRYVAHHTFVAFGIYRIIAGLVVLALTAVRLI